MFNMLKSKKIWGFVVSIFFLWLALRKVDWSSIPDILSKIDYSFILLMCFTYTLEHLARAYRWRAILPGKYLKIKFAYFGIVLGYLFNNLLPARAGEFVRSFYLKKKKTAPASEIFGSVVFERFLDGLVIISLIVFSLNYFPSTDLVKQAGVSAVIFYLVILFVIILLQFKRNLVLKFTRKIFSTFPSKVAEFLHDSEESFINGLGLIARPKKFFRALLLSIVSWALSILTMYICLQMFNLDMGVVEAILLICILSIGSMIPTSPGMIGIYEYCCVLALHDILGRSEEVAVMFGLVSHTIGYFYVLVVGFIILGLENLSVHDLSHAQEEVQT
ncbi:MAG: lysylphosphatidylglycerol synthase transmembrane domain-containing protein [Candidatus Rifleibacteriota bacterium]